MVSDARGTMAMNLLPPDEGDAGDPADAARFALLQRLAPALRHGMVGALHPIELIVEAIDRRLQTPAPDLANVRENLGKIKNLSRSAVHSCTNVASWLVPEEGVLTMLGDGIDECLALLKTDFGIRGFSVRNEAREISADVSRRALRNVLTASLITATDTAAQPSDLVLTAELAQGLAVLSILVCPAEGVTAFGDAASCRRFGWDDVRALARAESVELQQQADRVTLGFPLPAVPQNRPLPR